METIRSTIWIVLGVLCWDVARTSSAANGPYVDGRFQGRIAYSCDGNHNDPDDWIASPVTLAILAEAGLKDRLVHFDYNCILPLTDAEWEKTHAESVLGTAERYEFDRDVFFDCRRDRDAAVASIAKVIDESAADNPLYFIIAGPMEVPYLGIQQSDPAKRRFVYCISHSRWNDGFASKYGFTFTKRSVIEEDVHWVQIRDQNRLLSVGRYGRPSTPEEFEPYFWMRDSHDAKVRWLWERMLVSTRPDPSDAGMTYFLVSGDEECDPVKLKRLIEEHSVPAQATARQTVRVEAENFRHLEGCALEDRNDKKASHALDTRLDGGTAGRIRTRFDEPFTGTSGRYDVEVRYFDAENARCRFALSAGGVAQGAAWESPGQGRGWSSQTIRDVAIRRGDEIAVEIEADGEGTGKLDYVQLTGRSEPQGDSPDGNAATTADYFPPPESKGGWRKLKTAEDVRQIAGTDPAKLDALNEWLLKSDDRNFAAVVIRRGYIVLEVERGNSAKTDARRVASVSKAVCATVLGIAAERSRQGLTPKKMTFDDPAFDFIPQAQPLSDPRKARITVKQLLNHTSGLTPEATGARNQGPWRHVLGHDGDPLTEKLDFDPGTKCGYSTFGLYHASLVCENVTGKPYDQFASEALFKPIGVEHWTFEYFDGGGPDGDTRYGRHPSHGIGMPARDLARIAYCMLRHGRWHDQQVIPQWFVEETAAPTHDVKTPELRFNRAAESFSHGWELPSRLTDGRGDGIPQDARFKPGSGGQLIAFVPSIDLVITRQTGSSGNWDYEQYLRLACDAVAR